MAVQKVKSVEDLFKAVRDQGKAILILEHTEGNWYRLRKAFDAFSALNDCLWGDFYQANLKHGGDLAKWKTPEEALWAYRDFIAEVLKRHDLDLDHGMEV